MHKFHRGEQLKGKAFNMLEWEWVEIIGLEEEMVKNAPPRETNLEIVKHALRQEPENHADMIAIVKAVDKMNTPSGQR